MSERGTEPTANQDRTDLLRLGGVGVLGVVLALIGFSVASNFEPSTGPGPVLAVGPEETTTTTSGPGTSLPADSAPTTQSPGPDQDSTSTTAPAPATLTMSTEVLDFGESEDSLQVEIANTAGGATTWQLTADNPLVSVEPASGSIDAGATVSVTVSVDRTQIPEGEFETSLTLDWDDGQSQAGVVAAFEDNPIIHNPQASPGSIQTAGCSPNQATISARVRDSSEIDRVIARWRGDGATIRETAMNPVGNDIYQGVIGPYDVAVSDSVKIVAFDVRGNAGGASVTVSVAACA